MIKTWQFQILGANGKEVKALLRLSDEPTSDGDANPFKWHEIWPNGAVGEVGGGWAVIVGSTKRPTEIQLIEPLNRGGKSGQPQSRLAARLHSTSWGNPISLELGFVGRGEQILSGKTIPQGGFSWTWAAVPTLDGPGAAYKK